MRPDHLRFLEPGRVVEGRGVGERHDRADPRGCHQQPRSRILAGNDPDPLLEVVELAQQHGMDPQQRFGHHFQARMPGHELLDAPLEPLRVVLPTFRPKPRKMPRRLISRS